MKQLDPKAVWLFFFSYILRWLVLIILFGFGVLGSLIKDINTSSDFSFSFFNWLWLIVPLLLVFCFIWAKLSYHFYHYEFTDMGFKKESGVIYKKYITIPYDRIQNVDINRGILARMLGLSDLQIQTAGYSTTSGVTAEGKLPALSQEVAETLRDELIQRALKSKNQGL